MGPKIILIVIIIVVALGVGLYLYSSGVFGSGVKGFDSFFTSTSTFSFFSVGTSTPQGPSTFGPPPDGTPGDDGGDTPAPTSTIDPDEIPPGYTAAQLSPYFGEVTFEGISAATLDGPGTITLGANLDGATTTIDITGWKIAGRIGNEFIPKAINLYDPTGFTPASDILVSDGDTVNIYSSSAPFNLRLSECTGYLATIADFNPSLPLDCPQVDPAQLQNFTSACQDYVGSFGGCDLPDMSSPDVQALDYTCQEYLQNTFNYKGCFQAHNTDPDFLSNDVEVWTGSNAVDPDHDVVKLLDRKGLLVDISTY
jgi:hypothetical protein